MRNIKKTISPLLLVLCLCGFQVFEYPRGRPRLCLTILYITILWTVLIYALIEAKLYLNEYGMDLFLSTKITSICTILITLLGLHCSKKLKTCLNKLDIVNDTLEKLGTPKSYAKLRVQIRWLIGGWIFLIFFLNAIDSTWFFMQIPSSYPLIGIYLACVTIQTLHINIFSDMSYMILLRYVGSRFEQINQHIERLAQQKKQVRRFRTTVCTVTSLSLIRRSYTAIGIEPPKPIIVPLMHVHNELCLMTRELTTILGAHMVIQSFEFNFLIVQLVNEFHNAVKYNSNVEVTYNLVFDMFVTYIWITIIIVKMIVFNYICEEINSKANKTELFLNKITNHILDVGTQEYIVQFLYKLLQRPLRISGFGLYFGYEFLRQCVRFIGTVIIVTLQLRP